MDKLGNMALFVKIVKLGGFGLAGKELGISPARVTARINALEKHYDTRLLHRTTRHVSLTDAGKRFHRACLRVLEDVEIAETQLRDANETCGGSLRMSAPTDFGRQYLAPALSQFARMYPNLTPELHLSDAIINLVEEGFDLGIRYGNLPDSDIIVNSLAANRRVLVAAPSYLEKFGQILHPDALSEHRCLVLERMGEALNRWHFQIESTRKTIRVSAAMRTNDGSVLRQWALEGEGIMFRSLWDVKKDIQAKRLETVLDPFVLGFQKSDRMKTGLQFVYPSRQYVPKIVREFIIFFRKEIQRQSKIQA